MAFNELTSEEVAAEVNRAAAEGRKPDFTVASPTPGNFVADVSVPATFGPVEEVVEEPEPVAKPVAKKK